MNQGLLQRAEAVFLEVIEVPPTERAARLENLCAGDAELRDEVLSILEHHDGTAGADTFLQTGDARAVIDTGPLLPSTKIGDFTILGVLGSGGMGMVYRAEQERPRRIVALKLMKQAPLGSTSLRRFESEAELLGRLQHPGIAQIFGAGVAQVGYGSQPYFAMELIDGPSITKYASSQKLSVRERLELLLKVCAAAEHAHTKGVIHRDLKPPNILVGPDGEPKIVDFGIARAVGNELDLGPQNTRAGELLGTLSYMSPEQVAGDPADVDTRTDVYALGVVMYELLSGKPGRDLSSIPLEQALRKIREEDPPLLGTLDKSLKGDIETIAARATSRDRERRYQSTAELGHEIRRYLDGEPIEARRDSAMYVIARRLHRHKALAAGVCLLFAGLIAFAIYAWTQSVKQASLVVKANIATADAEAMLERSQKEATALRRSDYFNKIGFAQAAYAGGDSDRMMRLLDACPDDMRGWEWSYLRQFGDRSVASVQSREQGFGGAAIAPAAGRIATFRLAEEVNVWDVGTHAKVATIRPEGMTASLAISRDGSRLVTTTDKCVQVWDAGGGLVRRIDISPSASGVDVSPDGRRIVLAGPSDKVRLLDMEQGSLIAETNCRGGVVSVRFNPDGSRVVCSDITGRLSVFNGETGAPIGTAESKNALFFALSFWPDGKTLVTGGEDGTVRLWSMGSAGPVQRAFYHEHENKVTATAVSPSGTYLATGSTDTTIKVLNTRRGEEVATLTGHVRTITFIAFLNEHEMISTGHDGTLRWWDLDRLKDGAVVKADAMIQGADFDGPAGKIVASGEPGTLLAFDSTGLTPLPTAGSCPDLVRRIRTSRSGLMTVDMGGEVRVWRDGNSSVIAHHDGGAEDMSVCEARNWVASVGNDGELAVTDLATGSVVHRMKVHDGWATAVATSVSGDRIVTGGRDHRIRVWDTATWKQVGELTGHTELIWGLVITADGRTVASAGDDGKALLFPIEGGEPRALEGHHGPVYCISASRDGARLLTGGFDNTVRLWDTASGSELLTLRGHTSAVWSAVFSPEGDSILSTSDNGTIRLWRSAGPGNTR